MTPRFGTGVLTAAYDGRGRADLSSAHEMARAGRPAGDLAHRALSLGSISWPWGERSVSSVPALDWHGSGTIAFVGSFAAPRLPDVLEGWGGEA